jgi:Bifunctional DNA primase/polymerase, N-terminal/AAA domain
VNREEYIRDYIRRGWQIFRYVDQTTPPKGWNNFRNDETTPGACLGLAPIGVVLGRVSGVVVIDVDTQNGGDLQKLVDRYGELQTYTVATPSGGYHLYFTYPGGVEKLIKRINAGKWVPDIGPGIDFIGDGHHAVAPPSIRVGVEGKADGQYRVVGDHEVAPLPAAILADWLASIHDVPDYRGRQVDEIPQSHYRGVMDLHRACVQRAANAQPGTRDDTLTRCVMTSVKIALNVPDDVLTLEGIYVDYGCAFEDAQGEPPGGLESKIDSAASKMSGVRWTLPDDSEPLPAFLDEGDREPFESARRHALILKSARTDADRIIRETEARSVELPPFLTGVQLCQCADEEEPWLVDRLLMPGQSLLIAGRNKAGKTTFMASLIHALINGGKFLGEFQVHEPATVLYLDLELGRTLAKQYLPIPSQRFIYVDLKGRAGRLRLGAAVARNRWAQAIMERGVDCMIVDCISPLVTNLGLSENDPGVRALLDQFDELAAASGLKYGPIVNHHTGHVEDQRARGHSAFGDWPSATWSLTRTGEHQGAPRFWQSQFNRASGSLTHEKPAPLVYDPTVRRYTLKPQKYPAGVYSDNPYDAYLLGLPPGQIITVKDAQSACGGTDHTAKKWLDQSPYLECISEGGPGRPRQWRKRFPQENAV